MAGGGPRNYSANPNDYKLLEEVGYGASATVYRAIYLPFNEVIAVKCLDLDRCNSNLECGSMFGITGKLVKLLAALAIEEGRVTTLAFSRARYNGILLALVSTFFMANNPYWRIN